jgi:nitrogen fixation/metabolism regulation signal transduction histidine kinase
MSMEINNFFLPTSEDKKGSLKATINQKLRNSFSLTYRIPGIIVTIISFYPVFFTIYSSIATGVNCQY